MARTSRDLDKKLLIVGEALIQEVGVSGLSLREVAKIAEVNLGMLSYYFKGKDDFILKVLDNLYSPFILELESIKVQNVDNPEIRFSLLLEKMSLFSFYNRRLIMVLMKDLLSEDKTFKNFMSSHFTKHFLIITEEINNYLKYKNIGPKHWSKLQRVIISHIGLSNVMLAFQESHLNLKTDESPNSNEHIKAIFKMLDSYVGL